MADERRSYAETYEMRSTFFRLLGKAGEVLAEAYMQADRENQQNIRELAFEAMSHFLVERCGYRQDEIEALAAA